MLQGCNLNPLKRQGTTLKGLKSLIKSLKCIEFFLLILSYNFFHYLIQVRQQLRHTWARIRGKKVPYDESLSGTRTTVVSVSSFVLFLMLFLTK